MDINPSQYSMNDYDELIHFRDENGNQVLNELYGFTFSLDNKYHYNIVTDILNLVKTDSHELAGAIDIDNGKIKQVPIYCRNIKELELIYSNQLQIYRKASQLMAAYYQLNSPPNYTNNVIFRQIIADIEANIMTDFRKTVPLGAWDFDLEPCSYQSVQQAVEALQTKLKLMNGFKTIPGFWDATAMLYDLKSQQIRGDALETIMREFVPAGGVNVI
jgi:hypothetical protein